MLDVVGVVVVVTAGCVKAVNKLHDTHSAAEATMIIIRFILLRFMG
jgi:hypothetical protein